jgi:hypothetical protein
VLVIDRQHEKGREQDEDPDRHADQITDSPNADQSVMLKKERVEDSKGCENQDSKNTTRLGEWKGL